METKRKTYMHISQVWAALTLALVLSVGIPLRGQTTSTMPPEHNDTTVRELAGMDRFLDRHPEIAEQLRRDPSLINNKEFVENHPALQEYLQAHPGVREEFSENPNAFMKAERRYERREDEDRRGDRDTTREEIASMDRFMDHHPEIADQLRRHPSLINNKEFVENHPALQQYLQEHRGVREEFSESPNAFMRQEERYDRHEDATAFRDRDRDHAEMSNFGEFLRGHSIVADQLSKDPSLANNKEYLETHPELRDYLNDHPGMQQQLSQNPKAVMTSPGLAITMTPGKSLGPTEKPDPKQ